jgi:hypothetical protein
MPEKVLPTGAALVKASIAAHAPRSDKAPSRRASPLPSLTAVSLSDPLETSREVAQGRPVSRDFRIPAMRIISPGGSQLTTPGGSQRMTPSGSQRTFSGGSQRATPGGSHQMTPLGSERTTSGGSLLTTPGGSRRTTPGGQAPRPESRERAGSRDAKMLAIKIRTAGGQLTPGMHPRKSCSLPSLAKYPLKRSLPGTPHSASSLEMVSAGPAEGLEQQPGRGCASQALLRPPLLPSAAAAGSSGMEECTSAAWA